MRLEHWLYAIPLRLRSLFRWAQADQELDDELRDHLERRTEEYAAKGMAPEEARRRARLNLGGVEKVKEECRDTRGVNRIQDLVQDLHFGMRMLRKSPGFTSVAVLTLALGIGASTTVFSPVNAVLIRALPYPHPDRLVYFWSPNSRFQVPLELFHAHERGLFSIYKGRTIALPVSLLLALQNSMLRRMGGRTLCVEQGSRGVSSRRREWRRSWGARLIPRMTNL